MSLGFSLPGPSGRNTQPRLVVAGCQVVAEFGCGGVIVGQLLSDDQRLAGLGLRFRSPCPYPQQEAEVVVTFRQVAVQFGDGGVVVGQLLSDRQRPAVLGLGFR